MEFPEACFQEYLWYHFGTPAWDTKDPVRDQVDSMDGATYFRLLAELMKTNPPAAADAPMVATMARIGIVPGQDFDPAKLNQEQSAAVQAAPRSAQGAIMGLLSEVALTNGGSVFTRSTVPTIACALW